MRFTSPSQVRGDLLVGAERGENGQLKSSRACQYMACRIEGAMGWKGWVWLLLLLVKVDHHILFNCMYLDQCRFYFRVGWCYPPG